MIIELKKFGTTLTSREDGKEALLAFQSSLQQVKPNEIVEIDFDGVNTLSPSWADEFLTPLARRFGERLGLRSTTNLSVLATVKMLETANQLIFVRK